MTTIEVLQFPADSPDAIIAEVHKCLHIFRNMKKEYGFGLCKTTNLPLLVNAAPEIRSPFVCFYGNPLTCDLTVAHSVFKSVQVKQDAVYNDTELSAIETIGHLFRYTAVLNEDPETRKKLFDRAMKHYKTVALSFKQKLINDAVNCNKSECCMFYPMPNTLISNEDRRRLSHCFAGMALCALMGERAPMVFFSYSSAAISWEPFRRLELANVLRIHLLLVGKFDMQLVGSVSSKPTSKSWEFAQTSKIDDLTSTMINLPAVYDLVCKSLVLPMVLIQGVREMVHHERGIISDWNTAMDGASKIVKRYNLTVCAHCCVHETNRKFLRCSGCHTAYYCCVGCQQSNWKEHKPACKAVKK